jgi:hypothetical protein
MAQREKEEFVVTDRRKFRFDGEQVEHVEQPAGGHEEEAVVAAPAGAISNQARFEDAIPVYLADGPPAIEESQTEEPPSGETFAAPAQEDIDASQRAYQATAERMDDLMRANNPGAPHEGPISFERVIQSLYVTAIVQLGLNTPQGQQMRVDLMGARHTIDMLGVLAEKTKGNTTPEEDKLLQSALFELRMSFLEITQMLAQNAQAAQAAKTPAPGKIVV